MNDIDYANIKKELRARTSKFILGGTIDEADIKKMSIEDLRFALAEHDKDVSEERVEKIRNIVDELFETYGKEDNNMIILECVKKEFYSFMHNVPLTKINFINAEQNTQCFPIGMDWAIDEQILNEKFFVLSGEISAELMFLGEADAWNIFKHNDYLNDSNFYGVTAITRDYHYVSFVMREDGILLNDEVTIENMF